MDQLPCALKIERCVDDPVFFTLLATVCLVTMRHTTPRPGWCSLTARGNLNTVKPHPIGRRLFKLNVNPHLIL
uniref:Uncharacterized protein n=1 Tax=Anguilla anguilla TaxID=7936 RepID=A0A0E9RUQ6_ANGAN